MVESACPRAAVCTLGCRVNQYESEAIEAELEALGFAVADFSEVCDVYIINTCAVTGESERKSRQMIRRAAAKNPAAFVLVTGCFSQLKAEEAARIPGVDYVCGTRNKRSAAETAAYLVREGVKKGASCEVPDLDGAPLEKLTSPRARRDRSYVKIEDGCDNNCTYCIIKKARGGVVSRPPEEVIAEVRQLAAAGCHEVILTGIEAASYGKDIGGYPLWRLMRETAAVEGIERVRTGSLEPSVLTKRFCDEIAAEPRIMPSFHLSLQSGSNAVLAAMKRRYNREQVLKNTAYLRKRMRIFLPPWIWRSKSDFCTCIFFRFPQGREPPRQRWRDRYRKPSSVKGCTGWKRWANACPARFAVPPWAADARCCSRRGWATLCSAIPRTCLK